MSTPKYPTPCLFGPFRLDSENAQLWRGKQLIALTPKTLMVLCYFVQRPGQLVTKEELLDALWPDTVVSDGVLKFCIRELRKALGDHARIPQFIETVHRLGYRFIGPIKYIESRARGLQSPIRVSQSVVSIVGREVELKQLHGWLEKALHGERQFGFVTGEAGIGKTTLIEAFCAQASMTRGLWIGYGQCIEHYGVGEAYLPVLEALGRLCRQPGGQHLIALLKQHAPSWLLQMPTLLGATEYTALQRKGPGATRERMLREMVEAVEALTAVHPLIFVLEDLHWSDYSTLELLAALARRREWARLLVIGTYRPVDAIVKEHPLRIMQQELQLHGQCKELTLDYLSKADTTSYLKARFANECLANRLATVLHQRTEGNPLFMVTVVDALVRQGMLTEGQAHCELHVVQGALAGNVPTTLRRLIEQQLEQMRAEERVVLEAASVSGAECTVAAVAAGCEKSEDEIEEICEALTKRGQFLQAKRIAEWPDRTVSACYGFIHTLYHEVLYARIPPGRRARLHRRIGERLEAAYGPRAAERAAELAVHFERGRDLIRAVQYYRSAGDNALRRHGHREAIGHLTRGLELLQSLPETRERTQHEIALCVALGPPLIATKGNAATEVERVYTRARTLCQQEGDTSHLFPVLWGLMACSLLRAELPQARTLGKELLREAQREQDPSRIVEAHVALGSTLLWLGEVDTGRTHLEQGMTLYDPQLHRSHPFLYGQDPGVVCQAHVSYALWLLGYPDQALQKSRSALELAHGTAHPYSVAYALNWAAMLHQFLLDGRGTQEWAEAAIALSREHGFTHLEAVVTILRGWALVVQGQEEGLAQLREGFAAWQQTGAQLQRPYYLTLLAEAHAQAGNFDEGFACLDEALANIYQTEERWWEAEGYRLKGQLTLQQQSKVQSLKSKVPSTQYLIPSTQVEAEAEACFFRAIKIARRQQARSLELRAAISLIRLWQQQGKHTAARQMLAEIYNWFTEGFATGDLQEAKTFLATQD